MVGLLFLVLAGAVFAQELPSYGGGEVVIREEKTYRDVSPGELKRIVLEREEKDLIRFMQKNLRYGGEKRLFLRGSNHFSYHPSLPVLFVFDRKVSDVLLYTSRAKALFKGRVLVFFPPPPQEGKIVGFVVIFEDGQAVQFTGERVNPLKEKRPVATYYELRTPREVPLEKVVEAFFRHEGRCPKDGEAVQVEGRTYVFVRKEGGKVLKRGEVYACGSVWEVREY